LEIVWHILLTACLGSTCVEQDIQWFDTKSECFEMLKVYVEIPADGDWDTVEYQCKPVGSVST
tara:strand:- start:786 stop:974 length:189 start_codon:yes stop_codon:yes gene_type:complete